MLNSGVSAFVIFFHRSLQAIDKRNPTRSCESDERSEKKE